MAKKIFFFEKWVFFVRKKNKKVTINFKAP